MNYKFTRKHMISGGAGTAAISLAAYLFMGQAPAPQNCFFVTMPPVRYDYGPRQAFTDIRLHEAQVDGACRQQADFSFMRMRLQSCVIKSGNGIVRVIPDDIGKAYTACLIEHENGHINGWGANHEGARHHAALALS